MTCKLDPSVVSFLPGLALMKTTVWNQRAHFRISGWTPYIHIDVVSQHKFNKEFHQDLCSDTPQRYSHCVSVHRITLEDYGLYCIHCPLSLPYPLPSPCHRMCIKSIVDKSTFEAISDDCPHLQNFCAALEHIFTHQLQREWSDIELL